MTILEEHPLTTKEAPVLDQELITTTPDPLSQDSLTASKVALMTVIDDWLGKRPLIVDEVLAEAAKRSGVQLAAKEYVDAAYWKLVSNKKIVKDGSVYIRVP